MLKRIGDTRIEEKHRLSRHCGVIRIEHQLPDAVVDLRHCDCLICRRRQPK